MVLTCWFWLIHLVILSRRAIFESESYSHSQIIFIHMHVSSVKVLVLIDSRGKYSELSDFQEFHRTYTFNLNGDSIADCFDE